MEIVMKKLIALYLVGAIFTNSYVRIHRYDAWVKQDRETVQGYTTELVRHVEDIQFNKTACALFATLLWPAYLALVASDTIVSTKFKVEAPEILK
jgi:hypothetical protein